MVDENIEVKLRVQELFIPWCDWKLKGRLFAATPHKAKPRNIPSDAWTIAILGAASHYEQFQLVIPTSLLPANREKLLELAGFEDVSMINLMDNWGDLNDFNGSAPIESVNRMICSLIKGENVLILSSSQKISGFVPAIFSKICDAQVHPEKVCYPITYEGYKLTPSQIGYIYGLSDSDSHFGVSLIRDLLSSNGMPIKTDA